MTNLPPMAKMRYQRAPRPLPANQLLQPKVVATEEAKKNVLRERQRVILMASMLLNGVPPVTVEFMSKIYELFLDMDRDSFSITEMAIYTDRSNHSCRLHVKRLNELGYLSRRHYRSWGLGSKLSEL